MKLPVVENKKRVSIDMCIHPVEWQFAPPGCFLLECVRYRIYPVIHAPLPPIKFPTAPASPVVLCASRFLCPRGDHRVFDLRCRLAYNYGSSFRFCPCNRCMFVASKILSDTLNEATIVEDIGPAILGKKLVIVLTNDCVCFAVWLVPITCTVRHIHWLVPTSFRKVTNTVTL